MMKDMDLPITLRHLIGPIGDAHSTLSNQQVFDRIMSKIRTANFIANNTLPSKSQYFSDAEFFLRIIRCLVAPLESVLAARMFLAKGQLGGANEAEVDFYHLWFDTDQSLDGEKDYLWERCRKLLDEPVELVLGKDPVITWPWDHGRLIEAFAWTGENRPRGKWHQCGQSYTIIMPLRIGFIASGGNHSTAAGIVMNEGTISKSEVYDLGEIYPLVHTDGRNYIRTQDGMPIAPVQNPVFAAIFEIGRLIWQLEKVRE